MHFWRLSYSEWRSLPVSLYADMVRWQNEWNAAQQKAHDEATRG